MALSRTQYGPYLHNNSGFTAQGSGPFTTGSFTPPNNSLVVAIVLCGKPNSAPDSDYVVTGGGLTWTKRTSDEVFWVAGVDGALVQIWTAPVTTGSSMSITVTHTGHTSYAFAVFPFAYTGYDTSSPVGGSDSAWIASNTNTLTLSSAPATDSEVIGGILMVGGDGLASDATVAPAFSATEIAEYTSTDSFGRWQMQFRTGSTSTSFGWTTTTTATADYDRRIFAAIEIKAAPATGTVEHIDTQTAIDTGNTDSVINKPTGTAVDDLLILNTAKYNATAVADTPSGWNLLANVLITTDSEPISHYVFWRIADGSEGSTFSVHWNVHDYSITSCSAFRNVDTADPIDSSVDTSSGRTSPRACGPITPSVGGLAVLLSMGWGGVPSIPTDWDEHALWDGVNAVYSKQVSSGSLSTSHSQDATANYTEVLFLIRAGEAVAGAVRRYFAVFFH